jgi:outer membrane lipoprotein LolB
MRRAAAHRVRRAGVALALFGFVWLAGCRTVPPATPAAVPGPGAEAPWPMQREALEKFSRYNLTGRVAVAAKGQGFTASLRYAQQPRRSDLSLDGPLGIGGLRVELEDEDLRIFTSRGEQLDGVAARAELEHRLGFALPLAELRWWLLGIPAPGAAELEQDAATGEIHAFAQNGWNVSIAERTPDLGFSLPRRLTAEREGARLKLLVETWRP